MSTPNRILYCEVNGQFKSHRRLAAGAVLLGAVLAFGLHAGFHDGTWQAGASSLPHHPDHSDTGHAWVGVAGVAADSTLLPHAYAQTPDAGAFVTTWNVTGVHRILDFGYTTVQFHVGVTPGGQISIDWGDGEPPQLYNATGSVDHRFRNYQPDSLKNATVSITGDLERFYFHYLDPVTTLGTPGLLLSIDQWGDTQWPDMTEMFRGAVNMRYEASDAPDLSAQPAVFSMFSGTSTFDDDLSGWDVSEMTSLRYMFNKAYAFNGDISGWDVSKVTDMTYMFSDASNFNGDLSGWDVSKVTHMDQMFQQATSFNGDISGWDVSSVEDMHDMFIGASSFAGNLAEWDVSSAERMSSMFNSASAFNADISGWNVSSVNDAYEMSSMFSGATSFNRNLGPWFITLEDTLVENREVLVADISPQVGFDTDVDGYDITGADAGDFTISGGQLLLNSASDYSSKSRYDITITADTANVHSLGLSVEPSVSASIRVTSDAGTDPTFDSAAYDTGTGILNVTFSEPMSDTTDLAKLHVRESGRSSGGVTLTGAASQSVSGYSLAVTLSASQQSTVGGMIAPQLDIDAGAVSDADDNGIAAVADRPITINDTVRPSFDSAAYVSSTGILALTFDEPISGGSFPSKIHVRESGQSSGGVTLTGASWTTSGSTVKFFLESSHKSGIAALGTPQLDIDAGAVSDVAGNKIARTVDRPITINDTTPPTFDSSTYDEDAGILRITFSEPIYGLATDLSKIHVRDSGQSSGGTTLTGATAQPVSVGTLAVRLSASQQSTVNAMSAPQIDIDAGAISDTSTNQIATTPDRSINSDTNNTTITDNTPPRIASIERSSPASPTTSGQTLVYRITFSEGVTGVDAADFALSSSSTGGTGTEQFTQTRSPALAITQANTISDTITVPDSGTATSVSVAVDITHTYIGDLKIDLIAPDGTTKTVHNRSGGGNDDIDQTYAPDFGGESIAGTWTLRVNDNFASADDGTLNSWTLTINHGSSTTASPVTSVSGSGDTYYATVSATTDGTYNLDLVSSGHGIEDESSNPLTSTTPTGADETYTVSTITTDTTPPVIDLTGSDTVTITVGDTYDEQGATCNDAVDGARDVTVGGDAVDTGTAGTYVIAYDCKDSSDNAAVQVTRTVTVQDAPDTTAPTVSSIERYSPSSATTDSQTLVYRITFSEGVTGVDAADFALSSSSTGGTGTEQFTQTRSPALAITQANTISDTITVPDSGTATSVSVAVDITHTYIGDLKIDLIAPDGTTKTVHNRSGGDNDYIDQTYAPDFGGESIAGTWTLRIKDNYASADDGTLNSWTLTINHGSSTTASPVTSVSGSGDTYYATVSATTDGTYNLDLVSSGHGIEDESSNPLTSTTPTGADETYTVSTITTDTTPPVIDLTGSDTVTITVGDTYDEQGATCNDAVDGARDVTVGGDAVDTGTAGTYVIAYDCKDSSDNAAVQVTRTVTVQDAPDTTAPTVSSIERYSPSSATTDSQTLVYRITFSEGVTGVDAADFALSSSSTGGTGTGTEQFTQTRSPALAITQANTISDTITVPDSGTATSVSVAVDVTHTYIGDLKIDLIAPDGTTKTVHNRSGGDNDDIDQTYAPDFGGESIAGTWTLRDKRQLCLRR